MSDFNPIKFIVGAVLVVGGAFVPVVGGALQAIGVGMMASSFRRSNLAQRQEGVIVNVASNQARLPVVYGTVTIGGKLVDMRVRGTDNEFLDIVMAFCHGSSDGSDIEAIDEIYFDEELAFNAGGTAQGRFNGFATVTKYLGSTSQTADPTMTGNYAEWTANHRGRSVAYIVLTLTYDRDVYGNGRPNVTAKIRGANVFDPRDSTTTFKDNPALCIWDYMTSTTYGMGIASSLLDSASFQAAANHCDVDVGGGQKRFTCNGWVNTADVAAEVLRQLLSSCRGRLVYQNGIYRLHINQSQAVSGVTFDESNIVGDWGFQLGGIREVPNRVVARYIDPNRNNQPEEVHWPAPGATNNYLTADNGFEVDRGIDLPFTNDRDMAEQIAMVLLKEAREAISFEVTVKEEALEAQIGDIVEITHSTPGWTAKPFWVQGLYLLEDGNVRVACVEYDSAAYSLDANSTIPNLPDTDFPNPLVVAAPTGVAASGSSTWALIEYDAASAIGYTPRIRLTWTSAADTFVEQYEIQWRNTGGTWRTHGFADRDDVEYFVDQVSDENTWEVRIRSVNTLNARSAWVSVGSITVDPNPRIRVNFEETIGGKNNIIVNGDFELGMTYWSGASASQIFYLDTTTEIQGTTSGNIRSLASGTQFNVYQTFHDKDEVRLNAATSDYVRLRVEPGATYNLRATARCETGVMDAKIMFVRWNADRTTINGTEEILTWNETVNTEKTATWVVPAGTHYITINLRLLVDFTGAGQDCYFDGIFLQKGVGSNEIGEEILNYRHFMGLSMDNLILNPGFETGSIAPHIADSDGTWSIETTNVRSGGYALKHDPTGQTANADIGLNGSANVNVKELPVGHEGDEYYFEAWIRKVGAGTPNDVVLYIFYDDEAGGFLGLSSTTVTGASITQTYQKFSVSSTAGVGAPAGTARIWFAMRVENDSQAESLMFDDLYARRKASSDLIVDGAIITNLLAANAVSSDKIAANQIGTRELFVGSFDNLVLNPGLETGSQAPHEVGSTGGATGWDVVPSITPVTPRSGDYAIRFQPGGQSSEASFRMNGAISINEQIAATEGDELYFEAWVRKALTGTVNQVRCQIVFYDETDSVVNTVNGTAGTPTTTYAKIYVKGAANAGTAYAVLNLIVLNQANTEEIWFDDLYARRVLDGLIVAGGMEDPSGTRGVLVSGTVPAGWTRFVNLDDAGRPFLEHENFQLLDSGNISIVGVGGTQLVRKVQAGTVNGGDADGDVAVTFGQTFGNAPLITFPGFSVITFNTSIGTGVDQSLRLQAVNVTTTGFTLRAKNVNPGSTTAQWDDFADENSMTQSVGVGDTEEVNLDPAGSNDDNYTVHFYVQVTADGNGSPDYAELTLAIDSNDGGGWVERWTNAYGVFDSGSGTTTTWSHEQPQITVTGLGLNDDLRIRVKAWDDGASDLGTYTVRGFEQTGGRTDPAHGVTYTTASDSTESAIVSASQFVEWRAMEVA